MKYGFYFIGLDLAILAANVTKTRYVEPSLPGDCPQRPFSRFLIFIPDPFGCPLTFGTVKARLDKMTNSFSDFSQAKTTQMLDQEAS